jgi:hypothetical protein
LLLPGGWLLIAMKGRCLGGGSCHLDRIHVTQLYPGAFRPLPACCCSLLPGVSLAQVGHNGLQAAVYHWRPDRGAGFQRGGAAHHPAHHVSAPGHGQVAGRAGGQDGGGAALLQASDRCSPAPLAAAPAAHRTQPRRIAARSPAAPAAGLHGCQALAGSVATQLPGASLPGAARPRPAAGAGRLRPCPATASPLLAAAGSS